MIREMVHKGDIVVNKTPSTENLMNPFTKTLLRRVLNGYRDNIGFICVPCMLLGLMGDG